MKIRLEQLPTALSKQQASLIWLAGDETLLVQEAADAVRASWRDCGFIERELFHVDLQKPNYSASQPYIVCEYREARGSRPLDLSNAGSGTLQVLLLMAFLYARPAALILLDEPDAHQHIILQRQVYDLIRRAARQRGGQVIAATHSETVLDATAPEQVISFFESSPRNLVNATERARLREALKRVTTTDLLLARGSGGILYVESEADQRILLEWARTLDHPSKSYLRKPFVHPLGGRSLREAKAHFFAIKAVCEDIRALCLLDGDNRDEPDDETVGAGLRVLRWKRYEIENYLLQPEAIKRFGRFPLANSNVDEAFRKQIPADTDLFGDHVALTRLKASNEFVVPLLERVDRPTPKKDLYLLAAEMTKAEIHPEVIEKLDQIAATMCSTEPKRFDE